MARNRSTVQGLIPLLVFAVLALGGLVVWRVVSGAPPSPRESPQHMAQRQIREQRGADWEVRYVEAGTGPVLCGYAAPRNRGGATHEPVAFISRIGRVMFADDPLSSEFRDMRERFCPGFARSPEGTPVP